MKIREMNDYDLMRAVLDSGRAVVTAFVERGSGAARPVEKNLKCVAREVGDGAIFGIVDICENPSIAEKFGCGEFPCVMLFRDGRPLATRSGELGRSDLAVFIQQELGRR